MDVPQIGGILWDAQQSFLIALINLSPFLLNWNWQDKKCISPRGTELGTRGLKPLWEGNLWHQESWDI